MTEQQAMRMALEALETLAKYENPETKIQNRKKDGGPIVTIYPHKVASDAATALHQALEQADEPVAWMWYVNNGAGYVSRGIGFHQTDIPFAKHTPLYTRPQPAAWVGLTDEEIVLIVGECAASHQHTDIHFARAIEAALRNKNK